MKKLSVSSIVCAVADEACSRCTKQVIANLQTRKDRLLFGEDSGLQNDWDEVCVNMQSEPSDRWSIYNDTVTAIVKIQVESLKDCEREAIWLQTPRGGEWRSESCETRDAYPVCLPDVVHHILKSLYAEAKHWSNHRVRAYVNRPRHTD